MTTGTRDVNITATYPSGFQASPVYRKRWTGTDDVNHVIEQNYKMSTFTANIVQASQQNPYYPYSPPTYFSTQGVPDIGRVESLNGKEWDPNTSMKALSNCMAAIKGHDFNAASALADVEKTCDLLVNSVRRAFLAWRSLRNATPEEWYILTRDIIIGSPFERGRLERAFKGRDISDIWLAAQYGWKPFVKDVLEALNAFQAARLGYAKGRVYRGKASATAGSTSLATGGLGKPYAVVRETFEYRVFLLEALTTAQSLGVVPGGMATVVWERTSYSFVLDWFLPIGQCIELYAFFGSLSYTMSRTHFVLFNWDEKGMTPSAGWSAGSCKGTAVNLKREVNLPLAGLIRPAWKSVRQAATTTHLLNAAAIIFGLLSGGSGVPGTRPGIRKFGNKVGGTVRPSAPWNL